MFDTITWFGDLQFWHWWCLAVFLAIIEMLAPGVFFIWLAAAALINGLIVLLLLPDWEYQIVLFAILSIASLLLWHRLGRPRINQMTSLNRRGEQMIGRKVMLIEPIINGRGAVRLNDSVWRVEGKDMEIGTHVVITGIDGTILQVKKED